MTQKETMLQTLARLTPAGHAYYCSKEQWVPARHLVLLSDYLIQLSLRKITRLIVTVPPQNGKSTMISHYFPSWYLGRNPDHRIILSSYEAEIAKNWGGLVKDNVDEYGYELFGIRLKPDQTSKNFWRIKDHSGYMTTAGAGGPITSKSADLFIIDDPVKNAQTANSKAFRDMAWEWFRSVVYTRQQPGTVFVILQTRWHEDDLAGKIIENDVDKEWTVLNMPARCVDPKNDPLGRQLDEPIWPERFTSKVLKDIERTLGTYWWNSLYQGAPSSPQGTLFQRAWFRYCRQDEYHYLLPDGRTFEKKDCFNIQTVDPAVSMSQTADPFCLITFAVTPEKDQIILDVFNEHVGADKYEQTLKDQYARFRPSVILVENATFGITILQQIKKHLPLRAVNADTDKATRSMTAQSRYSMGCLFHCLNYDGSKPTWVDPLEQELCDFPTGKHDDRVDCVSYASIYVMGKGQANVR